MLHGSDRFPLPYNPLSDSTTCVIMGNSFFHSHEEAFRAACKTGNYDSCLELLKKGIDASARDEDGNCGALLASRHGHIAITDLLIKARGIDDVLNIRNNLNYSALLLACESGNVCMVEYLLAKGADIQSKTLHGTTTVIAAAEHGHIEIVDLLMSSGANVFEEDIFGRNALSWALENRHYKVMDHIFKWPATMGILSLKEMEKEVYYQMDWEDIILLYEYSIVLRPEYLN